MRKSSFRIRARLRLVRLRISARSLRIPELTLGIILVILVGLASGMGAVIFKWMIAWFQRGFFEGGEVALSFLGRYYVVLIPAVGGLLVGLLVYFLAREAKGHGVPEVLI